MGPVYCLGWAAGLSGTRVSLVTEHGTDFQCIEKGTRRRNTQYTQNQEHRNGIGIDKSWVNSSRTNAHCNLATPASSKKKIEAPVFSINLNKKPVPVRPQYVYKGQSPIFFPLRRDNTLRQNGKRAPQNGTQDREPRVPCF